MRDAIVVGAGIIGCTVAAALRRSGMHDVLLLDDARPMAGTNASGGHLKPSWFSGMRKAEYDPAMQLLSDVWNMMEEDFDVRVPLIGTVSSAKVFRVDTDKVLAYPRTEFTVTDIDQLHNFPRVVGWNPGRSEERCRLLVIATGVWASELANIDQIKAKQGVSFRVKHKLQRPFIEPWAPYKQVVAHQQTDSEVWIGDGSAILSKNWNQERTLSCQQRCLRALNTVITAPTKPKFGLRAYCEHDGPCLLKQLGPRAWVATGAGKSGTISAGWAAWRILNAST